MSIALGQAQRFNNLLRATPGMSKRILAIRLRDLEREGFISRAEHNQGYTRWELTKKGADVLPVVLTWIRFRSKWQTSKESSAEGPRSLGDTFEVSYLDERHPGGTEANLVTRR